jgi:hypothetical protein
MTLAPASCGGFFIGAPCLYPNERPPVKKLCRGAEEPGSIHTLLAEKLHADSFLR